jgi:hypothetical protein
MQRIVLKEAEEKKEGGKEALPEYRASRNSRRQRSEVGNTEKEAAHTAPINETGGSGEC